MPPCSSELGNCVPPIPDDGWITIRDKDYESLVELEARLSGGDKSVMMKLIVQQGRMYECPECGRLMWSLPGDRCANIKVDRLEDREQR